MAKRESKGGYAGGSTVFSPKDPTWFSKGSTRLLPSERAAPIPPRSPAEQAAFDSFKEKACKEKAWEPTYTLVKRKEDRPLNGKNKKMLAGPNGPKRPADVIGNAIMIAKIATGEIEETLDDDRKDTATKALGKKGGAARAKAMTPEYRAEIAKKATVKRWGKARPRG